MNNINDKTCKRDTVLFSKNDKIVHLSKLLCLDYVFYGVQNNTIKKLDG